LTFGHSITKQHSDEAVSVFRPLTLSNDNLMLSTLMVIKIINKCDQNVITRSSRTS